MRPTPQGTEPSLKCSKKLVVTLELANNKKYETERLDFDVACVNRWALSCMQWTSYELLMSASMRSPCVCITKAGAALATAAAAPSTCGAAPCCSPTGQCPCPCDYTADASCTCRNLAHKLSVGVTKSAVFASYPLTYVKKFNGRPYEVGAGGQPGGGSMPCWKWRWVQRRQGARRERGRRCMRRACHPCLRSVAARAKGAGLGGAAAALWPPECTVFLLLGEKGQAQFSKEQSSSTVHVQPRAFPPSAAI